MGSVRQAPFRISKTENSRISIGTVAQVEIFPGIIERCHHEPVQHITKKEQEVM